MSQPKNVQILEEDFFVVLDVMRSIDISDQERMYQLKFESVLERLEQKKYSMEKRTAYMNMQQSKKDGSTPEEIKNKETRYKVLKGLTM